MIDIQDDEEMKKRDSKESSPRQKTGKHRHDKQEVKRPRHIERRTLDNRLNPERQQIGGKRRIDDSGYPCLHTVTSFTAV